MARASAGEMIGAVTAMIAHANAGGRARQTEKYVREAGKYGAALRKLRAWHFSRAPGEKRPAAMAGLRSALLDDRPSEPHVESDSYRVEFEAFGALKVRA